MRRFGITTPRRVAHFLAQLGHESLSLSRTEESLSTAAAACWKFGRGHLHPEASAGLVHTPTGGVGQLRVRRPQRQRRARSGDGYRYRGRGPMQHTGRSNYRRVGELIGAALEEQPALLLEVEIGALAAAAIGRTTASTTWPTPATCWWSAARSTSARSTSKRTPEGLPDRVARTKRALSILGAR